MNSLFEQVGWDEQTAAGCRHLVQMAVAEDLDCGYDWTTLAVLPEDRPGSALLMARAEGRLAGLPAVPVVLEQFDPQLQWRPLVEEGCRLQPGTAIGRIEGSARSLLAAERTLLNLLSRLCGVATLTDRFVQAVQGTAARIFDTRKTTPGWRRLEKYAVCVGGGCNHRLGLFDAVLLKDNHRALWAAAAGSAGLDQLVQQVRRFLRDLAQQRRDAPGVLEIEVDTLDQLAQVLPAEPDVVLLDNFSPPQLRQAVQLRDRLAPAVVLEASGGITLETVRRVAETGVDHISVGQLTHGAPALDLALDWES